MATETETETGQETTDTGSQAPQKSLMDELEGSETEETKAETEGKTDEEKPEGEAKETEAGEKKEGDEDKPEGAPEEYSDFTVGEDVVLDPEILDEFKAVAKATNLSQEKAQEFVGLAEKLATSWTEKAIEAHNAQRESWRESVKTDPEIGGAKLNETLAGAKAVRDAFGTPELTEVLNTYGLGDHPAVIKFFHNVRGAVSEDFLVKDGKPNREKSAAELFYGETMKPAQ